MASIAAASRVASAAASAASADAVRHDDSRLSDARTPVSHTHTAGQSGLVIARGRRTTLSTATSATTSTTAQSVLRVSSVSLTSGRLYRVGIIDFGIAGSVAAAMASFQLTYTTNNTNATVSSSILTLGSMNCAAATQFYSGIISAVYAPSSSITFSVLFSIWRNQGTGTIQTYGDATWPLDLLIEDIGVDPGDTGTSL